MFIYPLNSGNSIGSQKIPHLAPIIGGPESEFKNHFISRPRSDVGAQVFAKLAWCPLIGLQNGSIEPAKTSETCCQCNLRDRQITLVQQTLRKLETTGLRQGDRRCSYVLHK
jgi:hypothetical protein